MPTILHEQFGGIAPRLHPTLLGANMAVRAHNCLLKSGKLVPIKEPAVARGISIRYENGLSRISDAKTLYMWHRGDGTKTMLAFPGKVYVAESNLSTDPKSRLFVSGDTGVEGNSPCVYMDSEFGDGIRRYCLCKESLESPSISVPEGVPSDPDNERYTFFFQTWVDDIGYESGVSMPSEEITYTDGDKLVLNVAPAPANAVARRIYKVVAGTESDNVQFITEQKKYPGADFFARREIRVLDEDAGEVIPLLQSPADDLEMICKMPNGFYAGVQRSRPREVRFSMAGNPTVWPDLFTASVHDDIIGLAVTMNTLFVMTKGKPWAITGTDPASMTSTVLATAQGCVSRDSICVHDGLVFYASDDGVCMLRDGAATAQVITDQSFSRREWQLQHPETCRMMPHDLSLYCWFAVGAKYGSLVINLADDASASITTHDEVASSVCVDIEEDRMYFTRTLVL